MARIPFVWEVQIRREVVDDELVQLRDLPYSVWRDVIGSPRTKNVVGRDGKKYRLTVEAQWSRSGSDDIRVSVTLKGGWRDSVVRDHFVITPENTFR